MKQNNIFKTVLPLVLISVLIAALALNLTGCGKQATTRESSETEHYETASGEKTPQKIGTGQTQFSFSVVDLAGNVTDFTVCTDEKTVGDALLACHLIAGDNAQYGLYVKTVNGITADYEKDGCYWAFYVDGKYASSSVENTPIDPDKTYQFKVEKQ